MFRTSLAGVASVAGLELNAQNENLIDASQLMNKADDFADNAMFAGGSTSHNTKLQKIQHIVEVFYAL